MLIFIQSKHKKIIDENIEKYIEISKKAQQDDDKSLDGVKSSDMMAGMGPLGQVMKVAENF